MSKETRGQARLGGADPDAINEFGNPLIFEVAQLGYRDLLLWPIQHGAEPTKKNSDGHGIQDFLAEFGKSDVIAFIDKHAPTEQ
jgi:hypothetical protein